MTVDRHEWTVTLQPADEVLELLDAQLTLDDDRAPAIEMTFSTPVPADRTLLDIITARVTVAVTLRRAFGADFTLANILTADATTTLTQYTALDPAAPLSDYSGRYWLGYAGQPVTDEQGLQGVLYVDQVEIDEATNIASWRATSGEGVLQGDTLLAATRLEYSTRKIYNLTRYALNRNDLQLGSSTISSSTQMSEDAAFWAPGSTAWNYVENLMEQVDKRLIGDLTGRLSIIDRPRNQTGTVTINFGENAIEIHEIRRVRSDYWYDAVFLEYTFTNTAGELQTRTSYAGAQPSRNALSISKPNTYYPGTSAAANILARVSQRDRIGEVVAVSDYTARPGMSLAVTNAAAEALTGRVASVTFNYPDSRMRVRSRFLEI